MPGVLPVSRDQMARSRFEYPENRRWLLKAVSIDNMQDNLLICRRKSLLLVLFSFINVAEKW